MSRSNDTRMDMAKESSPGVLPGSPRFVRIRNTGDVDFGKSIETIKSSELRDDRQISDLVLSDYTVDGSCSFEFSPESEDMVLEGALFDNFSNAVASITGTNISTTSFGGVKKIIVAGGSLTSKVQKGDWFKVDGFSTAANNGFYQAESVTATNITLRNAPTGFAAESAGASVTIKLPSRLKNSTIKNTYTIEQKLNKNTSNADYQKIVGAIISEFNLDISTNSIVTGGFSIFAKDASFETAALSTSPSEFTTKPFTSADVLAFAVSGVDTSKNFVSASSLSINNNVEAINAIGTVGAADVVEGSCEVQVDFTAYFNDTELCKKAVANESLSINYILKSGDSYYVVDLPNVKLSTGGKPLIGPKDGFATVEAQGSAIAHADFGYQIAIYKL